MYNNNFGYQSPFAGSYMPSAYNSMMQAQAQQQNQNVLPPCQILTASGQSSIDTLKMAPNSSALIAHETEPIIWKCVSDGLGNVTSQIFDVSIHQEKPKVDTNALEQRVAALEALVLSIGEQKNEPSTRKQRTTGTKQQSADSDQTD